MKKIILTICIVVLLATTAQAQVGAELGLGYGSPSGDFADLYDGGIGGYIEPYYGLTDNINLGLFVGGFAFAGGEIGAGADVAASTVVPVLATGTYKFVDTKIKPYAGLGLGLYFIKFGEITGGTSADAANETEFGFAPRAGVYLGKLNLGLSYNTAGDLDYLLFNLGFRIGS